MLHLPGIHFYIHEGEIVGLSTLLLRLSLSKPLLFSDKKKHSSSVINIAGDSRTDYLKYEHLLENMIRHSRTESLSFICSE